MFGQDASIVLSSPGGYYMDQVAAFPVTTSPLQPPIEAYKVCVCLPTGKVFAVPANLTCLHTNEQENPCVE